MNRYLLPAATAAALLVNSACATEGERDRVYTADQNSIFTALMPA